MSNTQIPDKVLNALSVAIRGLLEAVGPDANLPELYISLLPGVYDRIVREMENERGELVEECPGVLGEVLLDLKLYVYKDQGSK